MMAARTRVMLAAALTLTLALVAEGSAPAAAAATAGAWEEGDVAAELEANERLIALYEARAALLARKRAAAGATVAVDAAGGTRAGGDAEPATPAPPTTAPLPTATVAAAATAAAAAVIPLPGTSFSSLFVEEAVVVLPRQAAAATTGGGSLDGLVAVLPIPWRVNTTAARGGRNAAIPRLLLHVWRSGRVGVREGGVGEVVGDGGGDGGEEDGGEEEASEQGGGVQATEHPALAPVWLPITRMVLPADEDDTAQVVQFSTAQRVASLCDLRDGAAPCHVTAVAMGSIPDSHLAVATSVGAVHLLAVGVYSAAGTRVSSHITAATSDLLPPLTWPPATAESPQPQQTAWVVVVAPLCDTLLPPAAAVTALQAYAPASYAVNNSNSFIGGTADGALLRIDRTCGTPVVLVPAPAVPRSVTALARLSTTMAFARGASIAFYNLYRHEPPAPVCTAPTAALEDVGSARGATAWKHTIVSLAYDGTPQSQVWAVTASGSLLVFNPRARGGGGGGSVTCMLTHREPLPPSLLSVPQPASSPILIGSRGHVLAVTAAGLAVYNASAPVRSGTGGEVAATDTRPPPSLVAIHTWPAGSTTSPPVVAWSGTGAEMAAHSGARGRRRPRGGLWAGGRSADKASSSLDASLVVHLPHLHATVVYDNLLPSRVAPNAGGFDLLGSLRLPLILGGIGVVLYMQWRGRGEGDDRSGPWGPLAGCARMLGMGMASARGPLGNVARTMGAAGGDRFASDLYGGGGGGSVGEMDAELRRALARAGATGSYSGVDSALERMVQTSYDRRDAGLRRMMGGGTGWRGGGRGGGGLGGSVRARRAAAAATAAGVHAQRQGGVEPGVLAWGARGEEEGVLEEEGEEEWDGDGDDVSGGGGGPRGAAPSAARWHGDTSSEEGGDDGIDADGAVPRSSSGGGGGGAAGAVAAAAAAAAGGSSRARHTADSWRSESATMDERIAALGRRHGGAGLHAAARSDARSGPARWGDMLSTLDARVAEQLSGDGDDDGSGGAAWESAAAAVMAARLAAESPNTVGVPPPLARPGVSTAADDGVRDPDILGRH